MKKTTTLDRFRYFFDNTMSRGPIALVGWLAVLTVFLIIFVTIIVVLAGGSPLQDDGSRLNPLEVAWLSFMHTMDAGALGGDDIRGNAFFILAMTTATFGGIFVFSTLIGVLTSGIETRLEELRKGRSFVVESDHTLILGWSSQVFSIIEELVEANKNRRRACIVILAEKDKVEMEDEIRARVEDTGRTRIVCRTGSPMDVADIEIANPNGARSIIILSSESDDPDAFVIKILLALINHPRRRPQPYHVVAEIRDPLNLEVAHMVAQDEAQFVLVGDLISRIAVQTCRQSGLSVVYTELLDFGGDEIYFKEEPTLIGRTFADALVAYEQSAVIGLLRRDGKASLNPSMDTTLAAGDKIIAISQDDDTIRLSGRTTYPVDAAAIVQQVQSSAAPERTLLLGWNQKGATIINEMDQYVAPGSEIVIVAEDAAVQDIINEQCAGVQNQRVVFQQGSTTDRRTLDLLNVPDYDHVITLSYADSLPAQEADARTLVTLLHLRDIGMKVNRRFSIVSEMLDVRNRQLAEATQADDFIVGDNLVSLMLSQVSENKGLIHVFDDLFDPEGAELYLKPAADYVQPGRAVTFYTVVEAARRRGQVAIGYRLQAEASDVNRRYGVHLNPVKGESITFGVDDRVIVLAND
jgi:ion channel POLLUX/CASTOR